MGKYKKLTCVALLLVVCILGGTALKICFVPEFPLKPNQIEHIVVYKGEPVSGERYMFSTEWIPPLLDALNHLELVYREDLQDDFIEIMPGHFEYTLAHGGEPLYQISYVKKVGLFGKTETRLLDVYADGMIRIDLLKGYKKSAEYYEAQKSEAYEDFLILLDGVASQRV